MPSRSDDLCLLGVDGGTESLRAGVFDLHGTLLASASTPYDTSFPNPAWAEQDPRDWWQSLGESVRAAVDQSAYRRQKTGVDGDILDPADR